MIVWEWNPERHWISLDTYAFGCKIFSAELARVVYSKKKSSSLLFSETLSRWKWKMKIWENCNAKGKMTKNKCLSYKIRWLVSPISYWTSPAFRATLLGWWMNGKFSLLNKVAFQVVCKCLWCLYNKQNNTWLLIHMGYIWYLTRERIERGIYRVDNLKRNCIGTI